MIRVIKCISVLILTLSMVACGDSTEEKANALESEHDQLVEEINLMGPPSSTWSDEELNEYEQTLERFTVLRQEIQSFDSRNSEVMFTGGHGNDSFIRQARSQLASARRQKQEDAEELVMDAELSALEEDIEVTRVKLVNLDGPKSDWSVEQMQDYLKDLDALITKKRALYKHINQNSDEYSNSWTIKNKITEDIAGLNEMKSAVEDLIVATKLQEDAIKVKGAIETFKELNDALPGDTDEQKSEEKPEPAEDIKSA